VHTLPSKGLKTLDSRSNTHEKTSLDLANYVKSMPSAFRISAGFDSGRGDCGVRNGIGVPAAGSLLFYFCRQIPRVILLVFVLVSAATQEYFYFQFNWLWY